MDNQKLGIFITELRKEKGLTQAQLAQKLNVTDKAVSKWERGVGFPDIKLLEPLADVLDISLL
ncbi:helix-turn-helix transcriptional regulator, partial [Soehngenia saccharolytica]